MSDHHNEDYAMHLLDRLVLSALQFHGDMKQSVMLKQDIDQVADDIGNDPRLWRGIATVAAINLAAYQETTEGLDKAINTVANNINRYLKRD